MNTNSPQVSIVLPTYNRSHLLKKAVGTILQQTFKDFELIVVDDGSTDATQQIMQSLLHELNDPRIHYIHLEKNQGGTLARNTAIRQARGEFIASQDDDDEWLPTFLEKQVQNLSSLPPEYAVSYVSYWRYNSDGTKVLLPPKNVGPKSGNIYGGDIMRKNFNSFQTALIRKSVFEDVGYVSEEINSLIDWEMWLRISRKYKIAHLDEPLFIYYNTPNSNSNDPKKIWLRINGRKLILRDYGDDIEKFGYFPDHCSNIADLLVEAGDSNQARSYLWQGIRHKPTELKLWFKLISTFAGKERYQKILHLRRSTALKKIRL